MIVPGIYSLEAFGHLVAQVFIVDDLDGLVCLELFFVLEYSKVLAVENCKRLEFSLRVIEDPPHLRDCYDVILHTDELGPF